MVTFLSPQESWRYIHEELEPTMRTSTNGVPFTRIALVTVVDVYPTNGSDAITTRAGSKSKCSSFSFPPSPLYAPHTAPAAPAAAMIPGLKIMPPPRFRKVQSIYIYISESFSNVVHVLLLSYCGVAWACSHVKRVPEGSSSKVMVRYFSSLHRPELYAVSAEPLFRAYSRVLVFEITIFVNLSPLHVKLA